MKKMSTAKLVAYYGILSALYVVLALVSFGTNNFKVSIESLPLELAGLICGPLGGFFVGVVGEFIHQLISPYGIDPTTPLWLLPYICGGVVAGIFAKKNKYKMERKKIYPAIICAELTITAVVTPVNYISAIIQGWGSWELIAAGIPLRLGIMAVRIIIFCVIVPMIYERVKKANK